MRKFFICFVVMFMVSSDALQAQDLALFADPLSKLRGTFRVEELRVVTTLGVTRIFISDSEIPLDLIQGLCTRLQDVIRQTGVINNPISGLTCGQLGDNARVLHRNISILLQGLASLYNEATVGVVRNLIRDEAFDDLRDLLTNNARRWPYSVPDRELIALAVLVPHWGLVRGAPQCTRQRPNFYACHIFSRFGNAFNAAHGFRGYGVASLCYVYMNERIFSCEHMVLNLDTVSRQQVSEGWDRALMNPRGF